MQNRIIEPTLNRVMQIIKKMSKGQRSIFLQTLADKTCSECGSFDLRQIGNEIFCMKCGVVNNIHLTPQYLAPDYALGMQGSPTTHLAFGKDLGHTLGAARQFRYAYDSSKVLAKAPAGVEDIGLRVRHMRVMSSLNEPPVIHRMLEVGSALCREFGMEGDYALLFADHLGKLLRNVGFSVYLLKTKAEAVRAKWLAVATFVYVWQLMERDRGLRKEIAYEEFFPGARVLFKTVEPKKYKVDKGAWDFVIFEVNRYALWVAHERLKSDGELIAGVNRLGPDDGTVQSSTFLVDDHVSEGKKRARKPKGIPRGNLTEYQKQLLEVVDDKEDGSRVVRKSTVEMHVCSLTPRKSLGGGILANVFRAIQGLEQSSRSSVAEEQVRAVVGRLDLPGKSAKKQRQKAYDMYALLISVLKINAGLTPDLFIRSVVLRKLLEVYGDRGLLKRMPWGTRRRYGIVLRSLEQLPLLSP